MKTVWIVMRGENYEGGYIVGVFESREDANNIADAEAADWGWEDSVRTVDDGAVSWSGGCLWIEVQSYEVKQAGQLHYR